MKTVFKKLAIVAAALVMSTAAFAHGHGGYGHGYHHGGWGWGPFIGGAVVGGLIYEATRPVIVPAPAPVVVQPAYTPICQSVVAVPPLGYHYTAYFDSARGCTVYVLVPN